MKKDTIIPAIIMALTVMITTSGCVVGRKMSFENKQAGPEYQTSQSALIVFQDQRPNVLSGKSKPSLCGHMKSTTGISYNVQTKEGKPLADEFAASVSSSYSKAGASATSGTADPNANPESVIASFKKDAGKDRLLLFSIQDWDARAIPRFSTIRYEIVCSLSLQIYDKSGNLLASESIHDMNADEEGSAAVTLSQLQFMADQELNKQVTALFNRETIRPNL
jgi:hypothetical protein